MSVSAKIPAIISGAVPIHNKGITGKNITIAVMDSGLFPHPDIPNIPVFIDLVAGIKTPYDDFSHGTHVSGIIASRRIGVAPGCNIIGIKVLDKRGNGKTATFIEGIKWIIQNKERYQIRIANISIGGTNKELKNDKNLLNLWVTKLWETGIIVCCSAGNNGPTPDTITAPGNCKKVITVGSYDGKHFSSAGPLLPYITKPELVAPGTNILSTKPYGGYSIKSGTSMSVPFISGICALLLEKSPYLTNDQIKIRLMEAAYTVPYLPYNMQGAGVVNLPKLLS